MVDQTIITFSVGEELIQTPHYSYFVKYCIANTELGRNVATYFENCNDQQQNDSDNPPIVVDADPNIFKLIIDGCNNNKTAEDLAEEHSDETLNKRIRFVAQNIGNGLMRTRLFPKNPEIIVVDRIIE